MIHKRRLKKRVMLPLFTLLAGGTALFSASSSMVEVAQGRMYSDVTQVPGRYTGIVLGAYAPDGVPSQILEDRLKTALALYRAGKVQRLLLSGDHGREGYDEPNAMRAWLQAAGVAAADLFLDHAGFRTLDTMARAREVFEVKDAVVITQEFHLPRALFLADAFGIDAVGMIADHHEYDDAAYNAARERVARFVAWLDVAVRGRKAKFLGSKVPITGDAKLSWDKP
jgi:SanA protein